MKNHIKKPSFKHADLIQLIATFAAMVVAICQVIESPGRLAILLGLVAISIGFGASLTIFFMNRYKKRDESKSDSSL